MSTEQYIMFFYVTALCLGFMYVCYRHGLNEGREGVASGEIKMFLVEYKDKTKEWYSEKQLKGLNEKRILNKEELKISL
jgi:hypothetical protein